MIAIYQIKLQNAQERWELLSDWLDTVLQQYDLETRVEEKLRMEAAIQEKQTEQVKLEAEIAELTAKLSSLQKF